MAASSIGGSHLTKRLSIYITRREYWRKVPRIREEFRVHSSGKKGRVIEKIISKKGGKKLKRGRGERGGKEIANIMLGTRVSLLYF